MTRQDSSPVTILSYNSTGFPLQRQSYIKKLQLFSDVICGQEHFQLKNCKFRISNSFSDKFDLFFKPAVKSNNSLGQGRPRGGLFMAWKKSQVKKVTRIICENFRLQAAIFEYSTCRLLIINTYFPCDSQKTFLSDLESADLCSLLNSISKLQQQYSQKYDTSIILGDLNFDDSRYSGHTQAINNFLDNEGLSSAWDSFPVDFTFSSSTAFSTIDHFLISNTQAHIILEAGVVHDVENVSGHSPIYLKIDLVKANDPPEVTHRNPRLNWARSSPEQRKNYSQQLSDLLSQPCDPSLAVQCHNTQCDLQAHHQDIDKCTRDLLGKMVDSAWTCLEATQGTTGDQGSRKFTIPGWNSQVKPFQGEARFWYSLWVSAGKPIHSSTPGIEHDLFKFMKYSRNQYHFAVRRAQNSVIQTENEKLIAKVGSSDLFEEIRNICKDRKSELASVVDGAYGSERISNLFKNIYENLYNEQSDVNQEIIDTIYNGVHSNRNESIEIVELFDENLVKAAIKKLKTDKSDVSGQFTSDCLKSAPDVFFSHLASLFRSFLTHGYISQDLIVCALCPIVKDPNGDVSSSKNYRGIAISSLILKVLDNCILLLFGNLLSNDALQFGFQTGSSTVQCTWAVQETISHYLQGGSEVFCCLLDFSKAFDKVNFTQLFQKLVERSIPAIVLRLVLFIYLNQVCFIRWNSVESSSFRLGIV